MIGPGLRERLRDRIVRVRAWVIDRARRWGRLAFLEALAGLSQDGAIGVGFGLHRPGQNLVIVLRALHTGQHVHDLYVLAGAVDLILECGTIMDGHRARRRHRGCVEAGLQTSRNSLAIAGEIHIGHIPFAGGQDDQVLFLPRVADL